MIFPLWLQTALGYTSTWAGLAMAPIGLVALVMAPFIGRNLHRINLRLAPTFSFCILAATMLWFAHADRTGFIRPAGDCRASSWASACRCSSCR